MTLTQERLRQVLHYEPETGLFAWRRARGCNKAGAAAKCKPRSHGYGMIQVDGCMYLAHRLAWLYMTGGWPPEDVDHKDRCKTNNAWSNLRAATRAQNIANTPLRKNNTTGYKGVFRNRGRFAARITHNGAVRNLGNFATAEEASAVYQNAAREAFGEFLLLS